MVENFNVTIDDYCPLKAITCPENLKEKWVGAMIDDSGHGENYSAAIRIDFSSGCDTEKVLYSIIKVLSLNPILAGQFRIINTELIAFVPTQESLYEALKNKIKNQNNIELNDEIFKKSTIHLSSPENIGLRLAYSKKEKGISIWIGFWTFTCDGVSIDILIKNIVNAFNNEEINRNNWVDLINNSKSVEEKITLIDSEIYSQRGPYGIDSVRETSINSIGVSKNIFFDTGVLTKDVNLVAKNLRITPFALMFGIFQNAIIHLSQVPRIITGVPYINRTSTEEIKCIGPFSNTIPILTERKSTKQISTNYLKDIQKNLIIASKRQNISANKFYHTGTSPRNVDYTLPFPQIFNAWNSQLSGKSINLNNSETLQLHLLPNDTTRSGFELTLDSNNSNISGHIDVDTDAYGSIISDFKGKVREDLKNLIYY